MSSLPGAEGPAVRSGADGPVVRSGVVDLGSNSVRLVVFEGQGRNPVAIFNEKAVLRLGRGLQQTGLLNEGAVVQALQVMERYHAIARAMHADPFEVLATAAVRDAGNGPAFVADLRRRMPGVPIRILTGDEEASLSAAGLLCGIPEADGVLADIGGGSLELVRLRDGAVQQAASLRLGVIRLADRAEGDLQRARAIVEADLATCPWLAEAAGRDLYLVGGAWRALARLHMAQTAYPLHIVHHYTIGREEARELADRLAAAPRKVLERLPGAPRRRIEDLPLAATVLRRLLRDAAPRRVVFSANGIREGWFMQRVPVAERAMDPLLAAGRDLAGAFGRDLAMPAALEQWTAGLFGAAPGASERLRRVACWISDIGSHDHPDYRAEQAFLRVLRQPGVALDHPARAFLALTLAIRYEAEPEAAFLGQARALLNPATGQKTQAQAEALGLALRLAYTLSAGTPALLSGTRLTREAGRLVLHLDQTRGVSGGDGVVRRLDRLAQALGCEGVVRGG